MRYSFLARLLSVFICVHLWPLFGQQSVPSDYILGPDDLITLSVANLDEMSGKPMGIDMQGDITLPLVGHCLHLAGSSFSTGSPDHPYSRVEIPLHGADFIELAHPFDSANHHASLATLADDLRQTLTARYPDPPIVRSAAAGS